MKYFVKYWSTIAKSAGSRYAAIKKYTHVANQKMWMYRLLAATILKTLGTMLHLASQHNFSPAEFFYDLWSFNSICYSTEIRCLLTGRERQQLRCLVDILYLLQRCNVVVWSLCIRNCSFTKKTLTISPVMTTVASLQAQKFSAILFPVSTQLFVFHIKSNFFDNF